MRKRYSNDHLFRDYSDNYARRVWDNIKLSAVIVGILILLAVLSGKAQTVNGVLIKDIDVEYIQIVGTSRLLSNKVSIEIDFGQENKIFTTKDTQIRDESNKVVVFNSMIDALNFMTGHGYEFVQAYAFAVGTSHNVYHYLLKRKK